MTQVSILSYLLWAQPKVTLDLCKLAHRKNTFLLLLLLFVVVVVTSHPLDCDVNLVLKYVASTPVLHSSGSVRSIEIDAASDQPENHHHHQLHGSKLLINTHWNPDLKEQHS